MKRVLVVDDELSMCEFLAIMLSKEGYSVTTTRSGEEGTELFQRDPFDVVITDMRLPGIGGLGVLRAIKEQSPEVPVIVMTAYSSVANAVEVMKLGAYDYITKPFKVDEIKLVMRNALEKKVLAEENVALRRERVAAGEFAGMVGRGPAMNKIYQMIKQVAFSRSTVLITGESGTGKELVARAIHNCGPRKDAPFMSINCAALPQELLESELFGHQKGAFTGAVATKKGLLELADGGTFLLDEVSEMSPALQVKLLRVLQEREFRRVGGTEDISVDVRIIAASNTDLANAVKEKRFREDLFYRLNVIPLEVPPLRNRKEDIPLLAGHFIRKYNRENNGRIEAITREALGCLEAYDWPGNVRELENVIERACTLQQGNLITPDSLPQTIRMAEAATAGGKMAQLPEGGIDLERMLEDIERQYIEQALERSGGAKKKAAEMLNLSFRSMRYRLKKMNIGNRSEQQDDEA